MSGQANVSNRREARRKSAQELKESRAKLSHKQQLKALDERLGDNVGAKKERAQLQLLINNIKSNKE